MIGHMRYFAIFIALTILATACATAQPQPPQSEETSAEQINTLPPYPEAKREDVVDTINGYTVRDPYRWMETEGAAENWIEAENAYTEKYLSRFKYDGLEEQVNRLFSIGYIGDVQIAGNRIFFIRRQGEKMEQAQLILREGDLEQVLVDPNVIDPDFKTTIDWMHPSNDGGLLAYGLSKDGSENSTLYILDVATGKKLTDMIPETRHASLTWLPDASGFYYTRYPAEDRYNRKVYYHALGTDPANDPLIFGDKRDKADWTHLVLSDDGRYLLIGEYRGWTNTDLYVYDTKSKKLRTLFLDLGSMIQGMEMNGGMLYALTNKDAPNGRIVTIDLNKPNHDAWKTLIPEGDFPMEHFVVAGNRLVIKTLENVSNHLAVYSLSGKKLGEIALPAVGMVEGPDATLGSDRIVFSYTSFFYPSIAFEALTAGDSFKAAEFASIGGSFDPSAFIASQITYPSYDGTMINMFLVHKKAIKLDGSHQTLLYGYGGFNVNMAPYFSRRVMTWLERGGVYAVANLRGGGEYGEAWHEAGMRDKKHQVFRDFEYAARYLLQENYTRPDRLLIEGGSNGGLLVGAMMAEVPYLFAGALGSVGLYDMVRYHLFPPGELWVPEYGSADNPKDTGYLLGYSPYHQIVPGVAYPAFFGHTADTDTRVHWVHTAKFVASLQHNSIGTQPLLFYIDRRAGHGAGKSQTDIAKEYLMRFTFMFSIVGDPTQKN